MRVAELTDRPKLDRHRATTRRTIAIGSRLSPAFLIMNGLATIVASYGLLADSTAVVIGAMIIAMLLGPIVGLALALVDGDTKLLRHAITAEAVGVALVVTVGYLVGRLHFEIDVTSEILSRTDPISSIWPLPSPVVQLERMPSSLLGSTSGLSAWPSRRPSCPRSQVVESASPAA